MSRRALICGISGQDGSYLAQFLLSKGYEVWGTSRDAKCNRFAALKALNLIDHVKILSMNTEDFSSVVEVFSRIEPDEIYNLSGQSSVGLSFEQPIETMASIAIGTLNQLEAIRVSNRKIRYFNAGSSECFGETGDIGADESSVFNPKNPYGIAKCAAHWHVSTYRNAFGLFACTGILFNHESPIRSERFVTRKVIDAVRRIAAGSNEKLRLGNLEVRRDWGWAPDYVAAMWQMLNFEWPDDFVIATGRTQSLQDFVDVAFQQAGLCWHDHVFLDPSLYRRTDSKIVAGNPSKAARILGWSATVVGQEIPRRMYFDCI